MDLFIYSDESGVFDKVHNEIFVYGGLIFLGKEEKDVIIESILRQKRLYVVESIHMTKS